MAPEQVTGDPVTPRTDVYAGCLVLRELLLGRPAFDERLPELELLTSMLEARLPPIERMRARHSAHARRRDRPRSVAPIRRTARSRPARWSSSFARTPTWSSRMRSSSRVRARAHSMVGEARGLLSQSAPTPRSVSRRATRDSPVVALVARYAARGDDCERKREHGEPPSDRRSPSVRPAVEVRPLGFRRGRPHCCRRPWPRVRGREQSPLARSRSGGERGRTAGLGERSSPGPPSSAVAVPAPASAPVSVPLSRLLAGRDRSAPRGSSPPHLD